MWRTHTNSLSMAEGDFGIRLPVTVTGVTLTASDSLKFTFKTAKNGDEILVKEYTPTNNEVPLEFTEEESELFPIGGYVYSLDWYQNGLFMCNLIPCGDFVVVDKA